MARRTAVTLIGSYVAFRTSTGSCIRDERRGVRLRARRAPAFPEALGTSAPPTSGTYRPRASTASGRLALIARPSGYALSLTRVACLTARAIVNPATDLAPAARNAREHASSVAP